MPQRGPFKWPNDAKVAVIVTLNLEHWEMVKDTSEPYYAGGPSILPSTLPGSVADLPNYSWREYGQRVGIWRLIDIFDNAGVPASCTINAITALERMPMVEAAMDRGWEIVAHNYEQGELLCDYANDPDKERDVILRTLKVYEEVIGRPAKGWLSSSLRGTVNTCGVLAEQGLIFFCDMANDDQPYLIETEHGNIVSIPYTIDINDFSLLTRMNFTTDQFLSAIKEELDVILSEATADGNGRLMNLGLHAHVAGRAFRVRAIREFLEYAKSLDGIWFATREEIAEWYLQNADGHIT
jgi:peptidoglycan/xylan/chitin deacetylase (PgdA/CDA1 family)